MIVVSLIIYFQQKNIYEESDGITFILFSNQKVFKFFPNTELFTIGYNIIDESQIPNEAINVTNSDYWKLRVGKKIVEIEGMFGASETFYGLNFILESNINIQLQYISENDYTFDALIVR